MSCKRAVRFLLVVSACLASLNALADDSRLRDEDDIREAVFRYQFEHNASGQQKGARVYCLSIGDNTDPSDEFMKRFAGNNPPVRKVSECVIGPFDGVVDKVTHKLGLKLRVSGVKWISTTEVETTGGYYEAALSASGNTYSLKKVHGKWTVTKDTMNWISTNQDDDSRVFIARTLGLGFFQVQS